MPDVKLTATPTAKVRGILGVLAGIAILVLVNLGIMDKEKLLAEGRVVFLELAPVDPRSLMQGDYMALNFGVVGAVTGALPRQAEDGTYYEPPAQDGHIVVKLDEKGVARFERIHAGGELAADEILMQFRVRNGLVKFATNGFFFQEGTADLYATARYGKFRVNPDGELLLTAMADENLDVLGPEFAASAMATP